MLVLTGDRPVSVGDPIAMRGDSVVAVTWVNKRGGTEYRREFFTYDTPSRLEIKGGWSYAAKHIPGVQNTSADGISRWPRAELAEKIREVTDSNDWVEQDNGSQGSNIFDVVLALRNILNRNDDRLWDIMVNGRDSVDFACTVPCGDHTAPPSRPPRSLLFNRWRPQGQGKKIWRIRRRWRVWWRRWRWSRSEKVPGKITQVSGRSGLRKGKRRARGPGCNMILTIHTQGFRN